jgi:hypothetical protein
MSNVYSFKDYDKHLSLKPPVEFWLAVAFFLRPFVLKISTIQMGRGGVKTRDVTKFFDLVYPENFGFFLGVIATIPVVLIFIALAKRKPGASVLVKKIWRNSVNLMMVAALLNIVVIFLPLFLGKAHSIHLVGWAQLIITFLIMGYLVKSQRLRDTFADFPVEADAEKSKVKKA